MHKFALFNNEILPAQNIKINAISSAGLYGKGVFTTIAIYNSKPFLWEKHWKRLNENSGKIGVDLSEFTEHKIYESLQQLIEQNNIINGRCRITFFDESSSTIWQTSSKDKTSILIQTADLHKQNKELSVYVSSISINSHSPLAGIKSCNYMENILALKEAKKYGFDEAIRYNERSDVTSFCMGNIFWLQFDDEKLYTPSLKTGCLAGTTRELIIDNFEVQEVEININSFYGLAETIFITSSGRGVQRVTKIDGEKINLRDHKILNLIEKKIADNH